MSPNGLVKVKTQESLRQRLALSRNALDITHQVAFETRWFALFLLRLLLRSSSAFMSRVFESHLCRRETVVGSLDRSMHRKDYKIYIYGERIVTEAADSVHVLLGQL